MLWAEPAALVVGGELTEANECGDRAAIGAHLVPQASVAHPGGQQLLDGAPTHPALADAQTRPGAELEGAQRPGPGALSGRTQRSEADLLTAADNRVGGEYLLPTGPDGVCRLDPPGEARKCAARPHGSANLVVGCQPPRGHVAGDGTFGHRQVSPANAGDLPSGVNASHAGVLCLVDGHKSSSGEP